MLAAAIVLLMDWHAIRLALDLDWAYLLVSLWGGAMLVPIALLLVMLCVCFAGRSRKPVALGCFVLGAIAAGVFIASGPYYTQAVGTPSRLRIPYEPGPWVVTAGDVTYNPLAMGVFTAIATCLLPLTALKFLPQSSPTPAELRGLRGVVARARTLRRSLVLNPFRLIFGPIFQRDVRITGRHRSTYVFRALYPAMLLGITVIAYVGMSQSLVQAIPPGAQVVPGGRVAELQALQRLAPQLTYTIAWAQYVLLLMISPVLTAPSLCEEKRARTLGSLLTTPLSNLQIVLAKLASRMMHVVILVAASTPLLLAARVFGGVDAEVILAILAITLTSSLMAASMGMHFSVIHRKSATAAIGGILATGAVLAIPAVGIFVYAMQSATPPSWPLVWGASGPVAMAFVLFGPPIVTVDMTSVWVTNCLFNLAITAIVCFSSAVSLRRVMLREVVDEGAALKALSARAKRRAAKAAAAAAAAGRAPGATSSAQTPDQALPAPELEIASGSRTVSDRPVLWRELRQSALGSRFKLIIAIVGVLLCGAFLYARMDVFDAYLHMTVAGIAIFALCLQAAVASTATIGAERESQSWETLMTTPLTARDVLLGKYLGSLKRMWLPFAVLTLHFTVSMLRGYVHPIAVLEVLLLAVCVPAMLCASGLLLSLVLRRSTAAAVANLGFAAALWVGAPMFAVFCLEAFSFHGPDEELIMGYFMCMNPVVMGVAAVSGAVSNVPWRFPHLIYDFTWDDVTPWEFARYVGVHCAAAVVAAASFLTLATRLFPRRSGRSS